MNLTGCIRAVLLVALCALACVAAGADTHYVPADHATIQAAINAATNGDAVVVAPGTYHEQIVFNGKAITVQSTHPTTPATVAATIINGDATGSVVTFSTADPGAGVLDGFTITNGSGQSGAISCLYCSPTITNNVITGSTASIAGGGIYCYGASPIIRNNLIYGNHSDGAGLGGGIFLQSSTSLVENNTVCGNSAGSGGGIWSDGNLTTIRNNIVAFNTGGGGMQGSGATITYCDVYSNTGGNYTDGAVAGTGCIARDPLFVNAAGGDYGLKSQAGHCTAGVWVKDTVSSPCLDAGDPTSAWNLEPAPHGNRVNMGADANTTHASKSAVPWVLLWTPKGTGVSRHAAIVVRFSLTMSRGTVENNFLLNGTKPTTGTFAWVGTKLTYTPALGWKAGKRYTVTIGRHARTTLAVELGTNKTWGFTTGAAAPAMVTASAAPTASGAQIAIGLADEAAVEVRILNVAGREVAALPSRDLPAGLSTLLWSGKTTTGTRAPAGVYLVRVIAKSTAGGSSSATATLRR